MPRSEYILRMQTQSTSRVHLDPVLVKSNKEVTATNLSPEGAAANMISTAISTVVNERKIKVFLNFNYETFKYIYKSLSKAFLNDFLCFINLKNQLLTLL